MRHHPALPWLGAAVAYLALAVLLTWPLVLHLGDATAGLPNIDHFDTAWLRLATARMVTQPATWAMSPEVAAPTGYPLYNLLPNYVDHITATPFVLALPWPLGDNLWLLCVLAGNGLAGHVLGWSLTGSHRSGFLTGVAFACAEPILREANQGHAPQMMGFAAPLYLAAFLRVLTDSGTWRAAVAMGLTMAVAALTYWYNAMFLATVSVPIAAWGLARSRRRRAVTLRLALSVATCVVICAGPLALTLSYWQGLPQTGEQGLPALQFTESAALLPEAWRWPFAQADDLLWFARPTPMDRSSRLSVALLGACVVGAWSMPRGSRWPFVTAAVLGALAIMGPYLKLGEEPLFVFGQPIALPWRWVAPFSETLSRFHWPQRWGWVIPLALLPLAARAYKPRLWAVVLVVETLVLSTNAPLHLIPTQQFDGWRSLAAAEGSILVLPIQRHGPREGLVRLVYRASTRPLVTPPNVPPGARPASEWEAWERVDPFMVWWRSHQHHSGTAFPSTAWTDCASAGCPRLPSTPHRGAPRRPSSATGPGASSKPDSDPRPTTAALSCGGSSPRVRCPRPWRSPTSGARRCASC